jgi:hypothetical protein
MGNVSFFRSETDSARANLTSLQAIVECIDNLERHLALLAVFYLGWLLSATFGVPVRQKIF